MNSRLDRVLVLALAVVMIATVGTILLSTRATTERATIQQMEQVMTRVAFEASDEAGAFLGPAESLARLTADLLEDGVFSEHDDPDEFEEFLIDVLRENPLHAGFFVGRSDGDFFYVSRNEERVPGGLRTKVISVGGEERRTNYVYRAADGEVVATDEDPDDTYDPRARPWYIGATETGGVIWTDPYIFFTSRQPGITTAAPVKDETGRTVGAFGVDVEIRELSEILAHLPISDEGAAFIVDFGGQLVATSSAVELGLEDGNSLRRATPAEVDDPAVTAAYSTLLAMGGPQVEGPTFETFMVDGRRWRAAYEPFATGRWPWTIAVFAPEDDFLGEVRATQAANTRLGVGVGIVALVVALALTTGLTRPLARMRRSVETDQLTSLGNRRRLERQGSAMLEAAVAEGTPLAALMLDIDHFKSINDSYGHNVGDEVLTAISGRLRRALRDQDLLVRQGGEEFAALLPDTDEQMAQVVCERLLAGIRGAPINTSAGPIPATISAGLAMGRPGEGLHLRDLLGLADEALYEAKRGGRDQFAATSLHDVEGPSTEH